MMRVILVEVAAACICDFAIPQLRAQTALRRPASASEQ
jgi:hypothetical protein